jgi:hypothetical protein
VRAKEILRELEQFWKHNRKKSDKSTKKTVPHDAQEGVRGEERVSE